MECEDTDSGILTYSKKDSSKTGEASLQAMAAEEEEGEAVEKSPEPEHMSCTPMSRMQYPQASGSIASLAGAEEQFSKVVHLNLQRDINGEVNFEEVEDTQQKEEVEVV